MVRGASTAVENAAACSAGMVEQLQQQLSLRDAELAAAKLDLERDEEIFAGAAACRLASAFPVTLVL